MNILKYLLVGMVLFFAACEEDITPIGVEIEPDIVIEGYIEGGEIPIPPIVALTRSFPFKRAVGNQQLSDLFIHNATVEVSDGNETVLLEEVCWDELSSVQKNAVIENFDLGIDTNSFRINVCLYTDLSFSLFGEIGKTYSLNVLAEGKELKATTTIPAHVPIDSLFLQARSGDNSLSYQELVAIISDPISEANYYRYFVSINGERFTAPLTSVADDLFFNGQQFEFPLPNIADETTTTSEFGFYELGDSIRIRWTNMDAPHYNFWNTVEFNKFNQGPFASYTRIESNVKGGLGVWGGYSNSYYFIEVN